MDSKKANLRRENEIDPVYVKSCKFLKKFTQALDKILFKPVQISSRPMSSSIFHNRHHERNRKNSIFSTDFNNFSYNRILSKSKCQFQPNHCDFASECKYLNKKNFCLLILFFELNISSSEWMAKLQKCF